MTTTVQPTPIDLTGDGPIPFALTPAAAALAEIRHGLADETHPGKRTEALALLERAEQAVIAGAAELAPAAYRQTVAQQAVDDDQYRELAEELDDLAVCTLPGLCDGAMHEFGHCTGQLADVTIGGLVLQVDIDRQDGRPALQVWIAETDEDGDPTVDQAHATVTDPAAARAMADALEAFAGRLRAAADTLAQVAR